jgi:hypothetical protein
MPPAASVSSSTPLPCPSPALPLVLHLAELGSTTATAVDAVCRLSVRPLQPAGYQSTARRAEESFYVKHHLFSCPTLARQRCSSPADGLMHLQTNSYVVPWSRACYCSSCRAEKASTCDRSSQLHLAMINGMPHCLIGQILCWCDVYIILA